MTRSRIMTPGLSAYEAVAIRRVRELPVVGHLHVKKGDFVSQKDLVASASLPGDLVILKIPEKMGLEAFEVIKGLKVKEGEQVKSGMLLSEHAGLFGLFKARFYSPLDGVVEFISRETGHLGLRMPPQLLELNAYISGCVVEIEERKAVIIENTAMLVQGIFGIGGEQQGILCMLDIEADKDIELKDLPQDMQGKVIVGGMCPNAAVLKSAQEGGARAFITASVDGDVLREYLGYDLGIAITGNEDISMDVIVTEGFGRLSFSKKALALLRANNGKIASVNGTTQVRAGALRPEIIVCLEDLSIEKSLSETRNQQTLKKGAAVRIVRVPYFGETGLIEALPTELQKLESGTKARVLQVRLESGSLVTVPRSNVELI